MNPLPSNAKSASARATRGQGNSPAQEREALGEVTLDLPLEHTEVRAEISGICVRVQVAHTFTNPYDEPIEAVYVFPLPVEAAVTDMQVRVGDRVIKGVVKKRTEAQELYAAAKQAGKIASLLDEERPNVFTQSVAGILPGEKILVELVYDEILRYEQGGYEFVFPMVVGPRFIPGNPIGRQGGGWSPDTDQVPDASRITPPVLMPGQRSKHDIALSVRIHAGLPIRALTSPSHDIEVEGVLDQTGAYSSPVVVRLKPYDTIPNKDFVLRYELAKKSEPQLVLLAHRQEKDGHFLLILQPPEPAAPQCDKPVEVVFLVDCSGSMAGEPLALAKRVLRRALARLTPNDAFQIICFADSVSTFAPDPLPATSSNLRCALAFIQELRAGGGTYLVPGLCAALRSPRTRKRARIICLVTDGYVGNEDEVFQTLARILDGDTRLFTFGIGSSANRHLLSGMGQIGRGQERCILLHEDPEAAVTAFWRRARTPALTDVQIDWGNLEVFRVTPAKVPALFVGQPALVLGQYRKAGSGIIRIQARAGGGRKRVVYEYPITLPETAPDNSVLETFWARSRIKELLADNRGRKSETVEKKVTELALKYRLMSPYTSFVAVEEKIVNKGGKLQTIQVPVEMPQGVTYEGVFGNRLPLQRVFWGPPYPRVWHRFGAVGQHSPLLSASGTGTPSSGHAQPQFGGDAASPLHLKLFASYVEADLLEPWTSAPRFSITLVTSLDGVRVAISVDSSGHVAITDPDPGWGPFPRIYRTSQLTGTQMRRLRRWLRQALRQKQPRTVAFEQAGTFVFFSKSQCANLPAKTVWLKLSPRGRPSKAWHNVIRCILKIAKARPRLARRQPRHSVFSTVVRKSA